MRQMWVNKQKLYYANPSGDQQPVYEVDDEGNIQYMEVDGEEVPVETGRWETPYSAPVKFYGNINSGNTGYAIARAYGISSGNFDAVLCMRKNEVPLDVATLIWYDKEPKFRQDGTVDAGSANYSVRRVPPCLDEVIYLLRKVDSNDDDN